MAVCSCTPVLVQAPQHAKEKPPTSGSGLDNWGRTALAGNTARRWAYAIDVYNTSSERCMSRCALACPTTRSRSLLCSLLRPAALQGCPALRSRLDFLRRRLPTQMFLRELIEAGSNTLRVEQAMAIAQNYVEYATAPPQCKDLRQNGPERARCPYGMDTNAASFAARRGQSHVREPCMTLCRLQMYP